MSVATRQRRRGQFLVGLIALGTLMILGYVAWVRLHEPDPLRSINLARDYPSPDAVEIVVRQGSNQPAVLDETLTDPTQVSDAYRIVQGLPSFDGAELSGIKTCLPSSDPTPPYLLRFASHGRVILTLAKDPDCPYIKWDLTWRGHDTQFRDDRYDNLAEFLQEVLPVLPGVKYP